MSSEMNIILISGDGHGAGKTHLAKRLAANSGQIFSVANAIRFELAKQYRNYDWYNRSPEYKEKTFVKESGFSIKQMLDAHGRKKKESNKLYWAIAIANEIQYAYEKEKISIAVIDDLRFVDEMRYLKDRFHRNSFCHFHIVNPKATPEPNYQNSQLKQLADYLIFRNKTPQARTAELESSKKHDMATSEEDSHTRDNESKKHDEKKS